MGRERQARLIPVGRVAGLHGVRGFLRIQSFTDPVERILEYRPWRLNRGGEWLSVDIETGKTHGKGLVVRLRGCDDRDGAARWVGADIAVHRDQMPALPPGDYYQVDLEGLQVFGADGGFFGTVERVMETGANDVLVVNGEKQYLVPFVLGTYIKDVDIERGRIEVDWDPDF